MKQRSRRTTRREVNRMGHKQARQVERQALQGGYIRAARDTWYGLSVPQPTLPDDVRQPPRKKSKKKRKKNVCPTTGKRHECLQDTREVPVYRYAWDGDHLDEIQTGTEPERYKICVNCDAEWIRVKSWRGGKRWRLVNRYHHRPMV